MSFRKTIGPHVVCTPHFSHNWSKQYKIAGRQNISYIIILVQIGILVDFKIYLYFLKATKSKAQSVFYCNLLVVIAQPLLIKIYKLSHLIIFTSLFGGKVVTVLCLLLLKVLLRFNSSLFILWYVKEIEKVHLFRCFSGVYHPRLIDFRLFNPK